ncbi:MutS-related protein [Anditalea andensis]|uniref:DNA mismatch repair proteins mutS family domain-containing protein n=1 Tax=Anditalea andensis TaxID=1048983 RepID=A0A074LDM1_9BACT|nr:hypothetical protein [Anditalea andensis]KEO71892.1 hypothetical protein EL17_20455 [Anditalea andensis]
MEYLILGFIGIMGIIIFINYNKSGNDNKKIEALRHNWGKVKNEYFNFDYICKYSDVVEDDCFHRLNDQTLEDIDIYGIFKFIDRTTSKVGQQFLFKKLIGPTDNAKDHSEAFINLFTNDSHLRENIQLELMKLNREGAYFIPSLLEDKLLERPKWYNLLILDIYMLVSLLILSFKFPILIIAFLILVIVNMCLHYWNKNNTYQFLRSFPQLNRLINVSKSLQKKGDPFRDKSIEESIYNLKSFQHKVRLINLETASGIKSELSFLVNYIVELIKGIFLIEVFALYRITSELENKKSSILNLFRYVGNIDASISIASLRAGKEKTCVPNFVSPRKEIIAKNVYHPLVKNCVKNSLTIKNKSILITGSNMSGKSTFLRSMIINSVLGQTIYTCFADEFTSPILKQFSTIKINDDLLDGKSYYFQEVSIMANLLEQVKSSHQNLFVLDEVFKGTNTIERIAAAKAILSYLNRNDNMVLVATHDIELAEMLEQEYDLYHFTETVENKALHFDHSIKSGQLKTRNAIKILELSNYPSEVLDEAQKVSRMLGVNKL